MSDENDLMKLPRLMFLEMAWVSGLVLLLHVVDTGMRLDLVLLFRYVNAFL